MGKKGELCLLLILKHAKGLKEKYHIASESGQKPRIASESTEAKKQSIAKDTDFAWQKLTHLDSESAEDTETCLKAIDI